MRLGIRNSEASSGCNMSNMKVEDLDAGNCFKSPQIFIRKTRCYGINYLSVKLQIYENIAFEVRYMFYK